MLIFVFTIISVLSNKIIFSVFLSNSKFTYMIYISFELFRSISELILFAVFLNYQGRREGFGSSDEYLFQSAARTSFALRAPTARCVAVILTVKKQK